MALNCKPSVYIAYSLLSSVKNRYKLKYLLIILLLNSFERNETENPDIRTVMLHKFKFRHSATRVTRNVCIVFG